jgi:phospholipid/cholesterol/gamma-HCH transport system substrate-binding protein
MGAYLPGKDRPRYDRYLPPSCHGLPTAGQPPPHGRPAPDLPGDVGPVGSPAEQHLVGALVAPTLDGAAAPAGMADLLMGPMLRGTAVTQR